jgi:hypothetical protein
VLAEQSTPPHVTAAPNITAASTNDDNTLATVHTDALSRRENEGIEVADAGPIDAAPEILRIELQTCDPNIRIIWLAPQK